MPPGVAQVGAGQVLNLMNLLQPPAPGAGREAAGAAAGAEAAAAAGGGEGAAEGAGAAAAGNNMNAAVAHLRQALERIVIGARQRQPAADGQPPAQAGAAGNAEGDGEGELDEVHLRELDSDEELD